MGDKDLMDTLAGVHEEIFANRKPDVSGDGWAVFIHPHVRLRVRLNRTTPATYWWAVELGNRSPDGDDQWVQIDSGGSEPKERVLNFKEARSAADASVRVFARQLLGALLG